MGDRDLQELFEQQAATSAILEVISDAPGDLDSVFGMIARSARRLCHARFCGVFRFDGKLIHLVAHSGMSPSELEVYRKEFPRPIGSETMIGRAMLSGRPVCATDVKRDHDYGSPLIRTMDLRSVAATPILCKGRSIGGIVVVRSSAKPFLDRQIELLKTFAANASIAVENSRLLQELQASNRQLSETLAQQVATGEILRLIAKSPVELQSVFEVIARNAMELCQGQCSGVFQFEGKMIHLVAHQGCAACNPERYRKASPGFVDRNTTIGHAIAAQTVVHIADVQADPDFDPDPLALADDMRCIVAVPMVREGRVAGVIAVWRAAAEPFTPEQIEVLKSFASLASLAIEDLRLLREAERQHEVIREVFGRYVPESVVEEIVSGKGYLQPIQTTATILFADLKSFTSIVEDMPPIQVVQMLNEYFPAVIEPIDRHGGVVNQFQGDAMLVTFNVPVEDPRHADQAVECAREIQQVVKSRTFAGVSLCTRIGISTGTVIAGNVGSGARVNYTVHGDAVNLAARLEQLNKEYRTLVLVSGTTVSLLTDSYPLHFVGETRIRGKHDSVDLYQLET